MMNETLKSLMERRSIRRYAETQISDEILELIMKAAAYSPNAGNRETTRIVISQNRELNDRLGRINKAAYRGNVTIHNKISEVQPSIADDPDIASAFYGAPTVVTLFGPSRFLYTVPDCWIMANNIALAAFSLGVGSCIVGRAEETFENPLGVETASGWGIPETYQAKVHILLGYPLEGFPKAKPRKYPTPIVVR